MVRSSTGGDGPLPSSVRIDRTPSSYRITYEVRSSSGPDGGETLATELLEVERPFRSLTMTKSGAPPGDVVLAGRVSDLNRLFLFDQDHWNELQLAPALAASDLRLDRVLDGLVDAGKVQRRNEVRRVAGRPCQVYRLGGPITGGTITAVGSVADEHADVCVDEDGLVLSEVWQQGDVTLRRRTAVDVAVDVRFKRDTFTIDDGVGVAATDGGGSARRLTDKSKWGNHTWNLPNPPKGFRRLGRWAVVWPKLDLALNPFNPDTSDRIAGMATVWVDGADALVVEQGGSRAGGRPFAESPDGEKIELGKLDLGEVITDARGTEVRVAYVDGSYVRVWSTLGRDRVIEIARSLVPDPGGLPTFAD